MSQEYLRRREFDGYVARHDADPYAHAAMIDRVQEQGAAVKSDVLDRISGLELWQARIVGAVAMLTFLVTCGVVAAVIELLRK